MLLWPAVNSDTRDMVSQHIIPLSDYMQTYNIITKQGFIQRVGALGFPTPRNLETVRGIYYVALIIGLEMRGTATVNYREHFLFQL